MNQDNLFYEISERLPIVTLSNIVDIKPPYIHFRRQPNEYILYYIISGEMYLKQGDTEYVLSEHDYIVLDPEFEHVGYKSSVAKFLYIHFTGTLNPVNLDEPSTEEGKLLLPHFGKLNAREAHVNLLSSAEEVIRSIHKDTTYGKAFSSTMLYKLLLEISMDYRYGTRLRNIDVKGKIRDVIPQLIEYLDTHYPEDITGASLETMFNFHFDYMNRQFSRWTGSTIFNYLTQIRIDRSRQLLATGFYSTKEVAAMTGFKDVSYFSKVFKKETGTTPGKWT